MFVDEIGGGLREAGDGAIAGCRGGFGNFGELRQVRYVGARSEPIEILFEKIVTDGFEFPERHAAGFRGGSFVDEDDGFGFESKAAMMGQYAGDVNPVPIAVFVGRTAGGGKSSEAEGKTTLAIIVDGAETDFVVTFVDRAVVDEFRGVEKVKAVHARPA